MALTLQYNTLKEQFLAKKGYSAPDGLGASSGTGFGSGTLQGEVIINVPQLTPVILPMQDLFFDTKTSVKSKQGFTELEIDKSVTISPNRTGPAVGLINNSNTPSAIINSDRVIINSKTNYTMVFGKLGVAISSPNKVNIDADDTVTLHGQNGLFLGVPNKGAGVRPDNENPPPQLVKKANGVVTKGSATADVEYEPLVLGIKLANWLDDLVFVLKNSVLLTPVGRGYFREDTQYDLTGLQVRIKEMLSTYAYIDGYSHEIPDVETLGPPPQSITEPPTKITGTVTGTVFGDFGNGTATNANLTDPLASLPNYSNGTTIEYAFKEL